MLECFHRCESLAYVFLDEVLEELLRLFGVPLEWLVIEVKVTFYHVSYDFEFRVPREWHLAGQHYIEHNT